MPIGEALHYAERYRGEGRLVEAEAVCRECCRGAAERARGRASARRHRASERQARRGDRACAARDQARAAGRAVPRQSRRDVSARRPPQARGRARRAARSRSSPNMPAALSNLGVALYELQGLRGSGRRPPQRDRRQSRLSPRRTAISATRCTRCTQFDEAIAAYRRAIELKPDYADAWANLGTTLHHCRQFRGGHRRRCAAPSRSRRSTPMRIPDSASCC